MVDSVHCEIWVENDCSHITLLMDDIGRIFYIMVSNVGFKIFQILSTKAKII